MPLNLLSATTASWGLQLSDHQLEQFDRYMTELIQWNSHTNLTTIVEPRAIAVRHFLDSLALAQIWMDQPPTALADIGTGAGFPGLPLKLLWPNLRLLLVESVGKKTEFLQHVVDKLGLDNVEISTARAEELGHQPRFREQFDAVTARAVATLNVLAEYCLPLCGIDGLWVAPKSADIGAETAAANQAIQQLGGQLQEVRIIHLPDVEERSLVVVRKVQRTPTKFPRRVGVPTKRPL